MLSGLSLCAQIQQGADGVHYDAAAQQWTLRSDAVEYRLQRSGDGVAFDYFGPARLNWLVPTPESPADTGDIAGSVDGEKFGQDDLRLAEVRKPELPNQLWLLYRHRRAPLEISAAYSVQGDTGVITRRLSIANRGTRVLHIDSLPSLAWRLPASDYDLTYLWGGWGQERQLATEPLSIGRRVFASDRGRSTNGYAPWFALRDRGRGVLYMAQLAWSGNWQMSFGRDPGGDRVRPNQLGLTAATGHAVRFWRCADAAAGRVVRAAGGGVHRHRRRPGRCRQPAAPLPAPIRDPAAPGRRSAAGAVQLLVSVWRRCLHG